MKVVVIPTEGDMYELDIEVIQKKYDPKKILNFIKRTIGCENIQNANCGQLGSEYMVWIDEEGLRRRSVVPNKNLLEANWPVFIGGVAVMTKFDVEEDIPLDLTVEEVKNVFKSKRREWKQTYDYRGDLFLCMRR